MASNITPASDVFSTTSMKPASGEECIAIWASNLAANTGFLAGIRRTIVSGDVQVYIPGDENTGNKTFYSSHRGWIDQTRHVGTIEVRVSGNEGLQEVHVDINGTADVYSDTGGVSAGAYTQGIADLTVYTDSADNGTLDGTLRCVDSDGLTSFSVSFDLYCTT